MIVVVPAATPTSVNVALPVEDVTADALEITVVSLEFAYKVTPGTGFPSAS